MILRGYLNRNIGIGGLAGVGSSFAGTAAGVGYGLWYSTPLKDGELLESKEVTLQSYQSLQNELQNECADTLERWNMARKNLKQFFCQATRVLSYVANFQKNTISDILINEIRDLEQLCISHKKSSIEDTQYQIILNNCLSYVYEILGNIHQRKFDSDCEKMCQSLCLCCNAGKDETI